MSIDIFTYYVNLNDRGSVPAHIRTGGCSIYITHERVEAPCTGENLYIICVWRRFFDEIRLE